MVKKACELLPAFFVPRMMWEDGRYVFVLSNGRRLRFSRIWDVSKACDGSLWIDIEGEDEMNVATINAAHIVAAFVLHVDDDDEQQR